MATQRARGSASARPRKPAKKSSVVKTRAARKSRTGRASRKTAMAAATAPQRPLRVPAALENLTPAERKRLANKLIRQPAPAPPEPVVKSLKALEPPLKRFHGMKVPILWFPGVLLKSPCADKFGYMFAAPVRNASKLPFTASTQAMLVDLGNLMGDPGREPAADSTIPAGYTYFGQFVDHDITFDVSSTIDATQDANAITNMRTPALDLDSVYGRGPALDPYLYRFPTPADPPTAVKFQLGRNRNFGSGGPLNAANAPAIPVNFDVPRILNGTDMTVTAADSTFTAVIGDPRNDENVIVSQFHHAMLKFHNRVVDLLVTAGFPGDIFTEAKKIVTHHYQWAVVHDFLELGCGDRHPEFQWRHSARENTALVIRSS